MPVLEPKSCHAGLHAIPWCLLYEAVGSTVLTVLTLNQQYVRSMGLQGTSEACAVVTLLGTPFWQMQTLR